MNNLKGKEGQSLAITDNSLSVGRREKGADSREGSGAECRLLVMILSILLLNCSITAVSNDRSVVATAWTSLRSS